jgi:Tfp pilus assembly protein FimT
MKKKILGDIAILAIAAVAAFNVNMNTQDSNLSTLALANIEALAQNESGTSVDYCYLSQSFSSSSGWKKFCDSGTNNSTIYPCPSNETFGGYSDSAKDRCTK